MAKPAKRLNEADMSVRPIGSLQQSMVLASLRAPRAGLYIIQDVCEFRENLDIAVLRDAWSVVSARYPALRTSIAFHGDHSCGLRVHDEFQIPWRELCWTGRSEQDLIEFLRQDRETGLDVQAGVPMRIAVLRTGEHACTVVWTSHHAVLDGRSYLLVWREWLSGYAQLLQGSKIPGAPGAEDVANAVARDDEEQALRYWRDCFTGVSETTDYIVDRALRAPPASPSPVARRVLPLSEELTRRLQEFAGRQEISMNNLVQSAWGLLLSRYSGRREIVFGVTRAGRGSQGSDAERVGFFINTLPLRVSVAPETKLLPWLQEVRARWLGMRDFERTPAEQVAKWSGLPPGMPPFESVLVYEHEPPEVAARQFGPAWASRRLRRFQRTDSPITLAAYGSPVLQLELIYDTRRFGDSIMAGVLGHLQTILASFVSETEMRLSGIAMLTPKERQWLLVDNNRTTHAFPSEVCAHELFAQQAHRTPEAIALETRGQSYSYDEVNRTSNQLAAFLRKLEIGVEDIVGVCIRPSPDTVIAVLAVLKAGAAFLPIDTVLPQERVLGMLADAQPKLVLCDPGDVPWLRAAGWQTYCMDELRGNLATLPEESLHGIAAAENAAYVIYTSGSAGKPKGVVVTHRSLVNHSLAASLRYGITAADRRLQFSSIGSDMFVAEIFNYLSCGATLVFGWSRGTNSVREFIRYLDEQRITITGIASSWWSEWVAGIVEVGFAIPHSLRAVITGMEKVNPAAFVTWKHVVGNRVRFFNAYGPTETTGTATVYEAGSSDWELESFVPIGTPLANVTIYVLDDDSNPVAAGLVGHLYIGGAGVARGYLNAPELTERSFITWFDGERTLRLYKTGDLVFLLPDGNLVFVGRSDRQVKIRGFRVELEEIEAVLAEAPGVRHCAVMVAGTEEKQDIVAYYEGRAPDAPSADDLRLFLARRLPEHMVPMAFLGLPEMPMIAAGKIDRHALPEYDPEQFRQRAFETPLTATEARLAEIWRTLLGVQRLTPHDSFFKLGANSLDATRLITALDVEFGREVSLDSLLRTATLGRLASLLDAEELPGTAVIDDNPLVGLQTKGARRPFYCFPGGDDNPYYFNDLAACLGSDQPFYVLRDPRPLRERGIYSVEEVAAGFIDVMRSVQREGPYIVGGHCYGGLIAFEVARQLAARGEMAARVIFFEVATPGYPKVMRHWKKYGRQMLAIARGERSISPAELRAHWQFLVKLFRRKTDAARLRLLLRPDVKPVAEPLRRFEAPDVHPNARAGRGYEPKPFACDIIHFLAADEVHGTVVLDDPRLGWKDISGRSVVVLKTAGKADQIFKQPYVSEMAARLRGVLDEVN